MHLLPPAMLSQQAEQQQQVQQSKESIPKFYNVCEMQHGIKTKRFQIVILYDHSRELLIYSFHFISDCQIRFGTRL